MATCGNCNGCGQVKVGTRTCINCLGEGSYVVEDENGNIHVITCGRCDGSGEVALMATCTVCRGTGTL
jgi:DnaJ-class molecular chaperone